MVFTENHVIKFLHPSKGYSTKFLTHAKIKHMELQLILFLMCGYITSLCQLLKTEAYKTKAAFFLHHGVDYLLLLHYLFLTLLHFSCLFLLFTFLLELERSTKNLDQTESVIYVTWTGRFSTWSSSGNWQ